MGEHRLEQSLRAPVLQSGVTCTPLNAPARVSSEGGGPAAPSPGQAPAVSYRLVKFDSSTGGQLGDTPGRFMLSGESAQASTDLFQTASLAKPAHKKVSMPFGHQPLCASARVSNYDFTIHVFGSQPVVKSWPVFRSNKMHGYS